MEKLKIIITVTVRKKYIQFHMINNKQYNNCTFLQHWRLVTIVCYFFVHTFTFNFDPIWEICLLSILYFNFIYNT